MAKGETKGPSENVSINLEGLRVKIDALAERLPLLKPSVIRERVVDAAIDAAVTAANAELVALEEKYK